MARWVPGAAGLLVAVVLAVAIGGEGRFGGLVTAAAWLGVAAAAAGVVGALPQLGVVAALLSGAAFCLTRIDGEGTLDARVVPVAAALLLLAELVAWSAEAKVAAPPGVPPASRLGVLALTVAGAGGITALVAAVVTAPLGDDLALAALGAAGVALVAALVLGLARSVSTR